MEMEGAKSHLIALTPTKKTTTLEPILLSGVTIPPVDSVTFLGARYDEQLNFSSIINATVAKASTALTALAILAKPTQGIPLKLFCTLVLACVLPKLDRYASLWYTPSSG
jgi:hypothetical protein